MYGIPYLATWLYFLIFEIIQISHQYNHKIINRDEYQGCKRVLKALKLHFTKFWNLIDLFKIISAPLIVLISFLKYKDLLQSSHDIALMWLVFCNQVAMWLKLFDWLRLYDSTAIYPIVLREVIKDIAPFIITMLFVIGLFANGLSIFSNMIIYSTQDI